MPTYAEKLKDPQWQKRRLEVLNRAKWACEDCGATDKELHVHHCIYVKGCEPWEYNGNVLMAVCGKCHSERQEFEEICHQNLAILLRFAPMKLVSAWASWLCVLGRALPGYVHSGPNEPPESAELPWVIRKRMEACEDLEFEGRP